MNRTEYFEAVVNQIKANGMDVKFVEVTKNNDITYHGVNLNGVKISPTVYLDLFYENGVSVGEAATKVIDVMEEHLNNSEIDSFITATENLFDFDNVKDDIYPVLINKPNNQEILKKLVCTDFLEDLVVIYAVKVAEDATVKITTDLFERWDVEIDVLHEHALKNQSKEGYLVRDILNVLDDVLLENADCVLGGALPGMMYVLTNERMYNGAAGIINPEILNHLGMSCYIIPSSVHEIILVPDNGDVDGDYLNEMINCVNDTEVPAEDVLSNHYYYYDNALRLVLNSKPCRLTSSSVSA